MATSDLQRFTLLDFQQAVETHTDISTRAFISSNVGIANAVNPKFLKNIASHPVLLQEMRVLVMRKGGSRAVVNLMPTEVHPNEILFLAPNSIVQFQHYDADTEGLGFTMSSELFLLAMAGHVPPALDGHLRQFKLSLTDEEVDLFARMIDMLYTVRRQSDYSLPTFLHLAGGLWWYVDALYQRHAEAENTHGDRTQQLFANFIALVNQHARLEHNLAFYAERLFLSQRYMSTLVKQVSGRSAKEWIDEALITAIKVELRHSDKPLKQISEEMNFANTSFFSKFFKNHTGQTPLEYRQV